MNYLELERVIIKRLVEVEVEDPGLDASRVERALNDYFAVLRLPPRPVRWVADARSGYHAARYADFNSALAALKAALTHAQQQVNPTSQNDDINEEDKAGEEVKKVRNWRYLEIVMKAVVKRGSVRHIPWLAYMGEHAESPTHYLNKRPEDPVWAAARDTLYGTARAAAHIASQVTSGSKRTLSVDFAGIFLRLVDAYEAGLWLYWVTPDEVIAVPRPMLRTEERRLHCATGPAVIWPEGERYYFLHGVEVTAQIVESPANKIDPRIVLLERNAEVRREIVRKIGVERLCEALGAQCVDRQGDYELLMLDLQDGRMRPYLKMRNPSVGVYHIEGVAPHCRTVAEALAWRNETDLPPSVLT